MSLRSDRRRIFPRRNAVDADGRGGRRFYSAAAPGGHSLAGATASLDERTSVSRDVSLQLCSYDDRWREEYEQARSAILSAAEGAIGAVEHVGATAVPGMSSLACIDLVAAVDDAEEIERTLPCLHGLAYCSRPSPFEEEEAAVYLVKPKGRVAAFSVTVVELGGDAWARRLLIRDWLRIHAEAAESYQRLRRQRLAAAPDDREGYERAKATFLQHIVDQADAHFRDST